jgi:hypothetical protein
MRLKNIATIIVIGTIQIILLAYLVSSSDLKFVNTNMPFKNPSAAQTEREILESLEGQATACALPADFHKLLAGRYRSLYQRQRNRKPVRYFISLNLRNSQAVLTSKAGDTIIVRDAFKGD